jgi:hypothetical protein
VPEEFSIPDLLSLLQIDLENAAIRMALESDLRCRRHRYTEAISAAKNAVQIAGHKSDLQGIALLYLSAARFATTMPDERKKSVRDCTRAIRALSVHAHNRAIAQIIRAKFESQSSIPEDKVDAIEHFDTVARALQNLVTDAYEHQRLGETRLYRDLFHFVETEIERLHSSLAALDVEYHVPHTRAASSSTSADQPSIESTHPYDVPQPIVPAETQREKIQDKLPIPTRLLWPAPEPAKVELFSPSSDSQLDYIDASQLSLGGLPYLLEPISPTSSQEKPVRLYAGKQYLSYQVEDNPKQRILVRSQNSRDQAKQLVVVADPAQARAWVTDAESEPPYTYVHVLGLDRTWSIDDHDQVELHIIGVVEAIMIPVESD